MLCHAEWCSPASYGLRSCDCGFTANFLALAHLRAPDDVSLYERYDALAGELAARPTRTLRDLSLLLADCVRRSAELPECAYGEPCERCSFCCERGKV